MVDILGYGTLPGFQENHQDYEIFLGGGTNLNLNHTPLW